MTTLDEEGSARVTGSAYVPLATAATYVFVAVFVLVIVFVAVPAREEVVRAGERGYMEGVHVAVTEEGQQGRRRALCSRPWGGFALRLLGRRESRADLLLRHLHVLQDVDIDEESLLVLPHAPQQESSFF